MTCTHTFMNQWHCTGTEVVTTKCSIHNRGAVTQQRRSIHNRDCVSAS